AEIYRAKEHLRLLFRLFRSEPKSEKRNELLLQLNALTSCQAICGPRPAYDNSVVEAFRQWPNLHRLPITISTNMAPGADTLAAEVALEDEFASKQFFLKAILPYPSDLYVGQASTYNSKQRDGTPDPANEANQQKFQELLQRIGESNQQVVRRCEEESLSDEEFYSKCKSELDNDDSSARRSRYYAAGEYIATNSLVMVAFWDSDFDRDTENGTGALVFTRRFGPRSNVLPTTAGIGLPHGGPLVHIPVRRLKNQTMINLPVESPFIRVLHPFAYTPDIKQGRTISGKDLAHISDAESQISGLRVLNRILETLMWFYRLDQPSLSEVSSEISSRFTSALHSSMAQGGSDQFRSLCSHLQARKTATKAQYKLEPRNRRTLRRMFLSVAVAAILFHLFAEWHPQKEMHGQLHHSTTVVEDNPLEPYDIENAVQKSWIRPLIGVCSAIAVGLGVWTYLRAKRTRDRDHSDDLRALAEGLRVQFYWNITGVGKSAPANYSLRQRSELDWIRSVIQGTSAPYDQWTRWFDKLATMTQVRLLEACLQGWIIDQENYFNSASEKKHQELHFWHRSGVLIALSGVATGACLVFLNLLGHRLDLLQQHFEYAVVFIPVFGSVAFAIASTIRESRATQHSSANPFRNWFSSSVFHVVSFMLPYEDEHTSGESKSLSIQNFFIGLPTILLIAYLGMVAVAGIARFSVEIPDAFTLSSVLAGAFLLVGGLMIAWAEKQQLSETGYQFNTMATLFRCARIQFEKHLNDLRSLDKALQRIELEISKLAGHATETDEQLGKLKEDREEFEKKRTRKAREIQDFIFELGREALDENAEWLILHRARPLEPVMAG
ncbi:MAG: hypothetical protein ABL921_10075, partial [Pirellula sp.]